jgi:hypothetical protein
MSPAEGYYGTTNYLCPAKKYGLKYGPESDLYAAAMVIAEVVSSLVIH